MLKIAHRGAITMAPGNTIESFKAALKLKADVVEFDVHKTKDKHIIVMHDHNVKTTTECFGLIKNMTLKQIRRCHKPNGENVPTLQEVLSLLKNKCISKIDIKDPWMSKKVLSIVKANKMLNNVIITSEIPLVLKNIRKIAPSIKLEMGGLNGTAEQIIAKAKKYEANIISPHYKRLTKKLVTEAHRNGLSVNVWTINTKNAIRKAKKLGVDSITTNYLERI